MIFGVERLAFFMIGSSALSRPFPFSSTENGGGVFAH
jgi:hypothetical protein